ncbi:MAG TPA: CHASE3 domain-containing protein, partial [Gemmatimonadaceae bacterium]|nr:CHASE3 domain-containing protein [Gemmatimonadaceae bacterium]
MSPNEAAKNAGRSLASRTIRRIYTGLALAIVALVVSAALAIRSANARRDQSQLVTHTFRAIERIGMLRGQVGEADRAVVSYAIKPAAALAIQADTQASGAIKTLVDLRSFIGDNPGQIAKIDTLRDILIPWAARLHRAFAAQAARAVLDSARTIAEDAAVRTQMTSELRLTSDMRTEEGRLLVERTEAADTASGGVIEQIVVAVLLGVIVAAAFAGRMVRDVRAVNIAESAALDSETELKEFFENTSDIIYTTGPDGKLLYTNQAWCDALG